MLVSREYNTVCLGVMGRNCYSSQAREAIVISCIKFWTTNKNWAEVWTYNTELELPGWWQLYITDTLSAVMSEWHYVSHSLILILLYLKNPSSVVFNFTQYGHPVPWVVCLVSEGLTQDLRSFSLLWLWCRCCWFVSLTDFNPFHT